MTVWTKLPIDERKTILSNVAEEKVHCGFVVDFDSEGKVKMINMTTPEFF